MSSNTLNRDTFNSLSIQEQINIINEFIKHGDSISNIAKGLGYNETTLRDRYKRAGYSRVTNRGIFVPNEELESYRAEKKIQKEQEKPDTLGLGDNVYKLLPAKQGNFSNTLELNNAVKRNINIRTNKELSRKLLSIYNFLISVDSDTKDTVNYTKIISGAISIYFDTLQAEYGELFNNYVIQVETEASNNSHHKAIADLLKLINEK